jgi:hypothetical protein
MRPIEFLIWIELAARGGPKGTGLVCWTHDGVYRLRSREGAAGRNAARHRRHVGRVSCALGPLPHFALRPRRTLPRCRTLDEQQIRANRLGKNCDGTVLTITKGAG